MHQVKIMLIPLKTKPAGGQPEKKILSLEEIEAH